MSQKATHELTGCLGPWDPNSLELKKADSNTTDVGPSVQGGGQ